MIRMVTLVSPSGPPATFEFHWKESVSSNQYGAAQEHMLLANPLKAHDEEILENLKKIKLEN